MLRNLRIDPAPGRAFVFEMAVAASGIAGVSFEVASIRPNLSGDSGSYSSTQDGRCIGRNQNLRDLIEHAYGVMEWQITGPAWILSERFDVIAKPWRACVTDQNQMASSKP
jgi:uncharacterized protein (TIGR03435 family)